MRIRPILLPIFLLTLTLNAQADPGFQSVTLTVSETWTGNAYTPPDFDVTGSEGSPVDVSVSGGARINLVDPFLFSSGALTIAPRVTLGTRYYLLYQSGWVVPTQGETALGGSGSVDPGLGSARVLTVSLVSPVAMEFGLGSKVALSLGVSPTLVFRIRAGDAIFLNDKSDLNGMYSFFYGRLRWLRPEANLALRFDVSEYLSFGVRLSSSVSILDLADATLPWWDQLQVAGGFELSATPPFSGLFRQEDDGPGDDTDAEAATGSPDPPPSN